jgi:hypothetical protein
MTITSEPSAVYARTRAWADTVRSRRLARLERAQRRRAERGELDSYGTARLLAMQTSLAARQQHGGRGACKLQLVQLFWRHGDDDDDPARAG